MLDSIYHMTLELLKITLFGAKCQDFDDFMQHCIGQHYILLLICKPLVVY